MSDKYKNGKIYTIRYKNDDSLIYVGSTIIRMVCMYIHVSSKLIHPFRPYHVIAS